VGARPFRVPGSAALREKVRAFGDPDFAFEHELEIGV